MELDHVFIFGEPDGADVSYLRSTGLIETYRRKHPGQGTENVCFCFDNLFLECLWITDVEEIKADLITRTALFERSEWRTRGTCPIGLAWRDSASAGSSDIVTWPFKPPYLPPDVAIPVAVDSDDPRQPMIFRSPGSEPPDRWPPSRRGALQHPAGLGRVLSVILHWPGRITPSAALLKLAAATILEISPTDGVSPAVSLSVERYGSQTPLRLTLPAVGAP